MSTSGNTRKVISIPCKVCNGRIPLRQKEYQLILPGEVYCCSPPCLFDYITEHRLIVPHGGSASKLGEPMEGYWSAMCGFLFRSKLDLLVAEWLVSHRISFLYECVSFSVGSKTYTPDFHLPKYGLFIEGKGVWSTGGREKFRRFRECYPHIDIVIVPYLSSLMSAMRQEIKVLQNEHWKAYTPTA